MRSSIPLVSSCSKKTPVFSQGVDGRNDKGCLFMKTDGKLDDGACTEDYQMVCSIGEKENLGQDLGHVICRLYCFKDILKIG